jgi:NTE family protein
MEHEQPGQAPVSGAPPSVAGRHALVLSGGGARAAYQVGVLRAVSELLPDKDRNPFPILCGTSAGSLNAAALACLANDFGGAVSRLDQVWGNFHAGQVYRADPLGICLSGARWLSALMFGWLGRHPPRSLLDNTPLRKLLSDALDFERIGKSIASGALYAVAVTASGYVSGESICFVEGEESLEMWRRSQRASARVKLSVEHLMASSAIPFIFPANLVNREYFGDGSMRQTAPISPAIHLGADRILVVGCGFRPT